MTQDNLLLAVQSLKTDDRFLARFRREPERALARYDLTADEVEALKGGDAARLLELGLDPRALTSAPISRPLFGSMLVRFGAKLAPAAFAAIVLALMPSGGGSARAGTRIGNIMPELVREFSRDHAEWIIRELRQIPPDTQIRYIGID